MDDFDIYSERVNKILKNLDRRAEKTGNHLNPDEEFTRELIVSLLINQNRYGYWACPCRLASGNREEDRDLICPCAYRDADVDEFGACFCALYIDDDIKKGLKEAEPVPERRPRDREERPQFKDD